MFRTLAPFLETNGKLVPEGLLGLLRQYPNGWEILLSFDDAGYVKGNAAELTDAQAMLKTLSEHSNSKSRTPSKFTWELKPQYDAKEQILEWAIRAKDNSETVSLHSPMSGPAWCFARNGRL